MKKSIKTLSKLKQSTKPESANNQAKTVTNSSVDEHRQAVLSRGRKFKYPFQKTKRKVALNSILIVLLALVLLGAGMALQLYRWQSTSDFAYRTTQFLPFPVAKVDGQRVSYESYLFELRSALYWERGNGQIDLNSADGKRQIDYYKRLALDKAITNTIAKKLAKENKITVSDSEVNEIVERSAQVGSGKLGQIIKDTYNFSESDMRRYFKDAVLRRKVAMQLDKDAPVKIEEALSQLNAKKSFAEVAKQYSDDLATKQSGGQIGLVTKDSSNLPKEVTAKIFEIDENKYSDVINTSTAYFIIMVNKRVNEDSREVSIIRVNPKNMNDRLAEYRKENGVVEYIKVPKLETNPQTNEMQNE